MFKKIIAFFSQEEVLVALIILSALLVSLLPLLYEVVMTARVLPDSRYSLFETDFPPDLRVYLSRMWQGAEGKWLVSEKFTSEPHQPSIFHISYLLMGKLTGFLGLDPTQAMPIWRVVASAFMLGTGYFFLLNIFSQKWQRLMGLLIFAFVGNFPWPAKEGITFLGIKFTTFLGWFTYYDPLKRLFFHPHYNLAAGFLALTMVFLWRGVKNQARKELIWAGIFGFMAGIILPTNLLVGFMAGGFLFWLFFLGWLGPRPVEKFGQLVKRLFFLSWPYWLGLALALALILYCFSYFPWSIQAQADADKRFMGFDFWQVVWGLGLTGFLGLFGSFYVLGRRRISGLAAAVWILSIAALIAFFYIFPISNAYRPIQIELHLPLAVISLILIDDLAGLFRKKRQLVLKILLVLLILPSLVVWSMAFGSQKMFIETKLKAGYPLIPKIPYVVYPLKEVMEAVFWLRDNTDHQKVVLAAETLGSMVAAYAGNTVYLGHGNQTVYFPQKKAQMERFYQGKMSQDEEQAFLTQGRIDYIFWGPEEQEIALKAQAGPLEGYPVVFKKGLVTIFQVK